MKNIYGMIVLLTTLGTASFGAIVTQTKEAELPIVIRGEIEALTDGAIEIVPIKGGSTEGNKLEFVFEKNYAPVGSDSERPRVTISEGSFVIKKIGDSSLGKITMEIEDNGKKRENNKEKIKIKEGVELYTSLNQVNNNGEVRGDLTIGTVISKNAKPGVFLYNGLKIKIKVEGTESSPILKK